MARISLQVHDPGFVAGLVLIPHGGHDLDPLPAVWPSMPPLSGVVALSAANVVGGVHRDRRRTSSVSASRTRRRHRPGAPSVRHCLSVAYAHLVHALRTGVDLGWPPAQRRRCPPRLEDVVAARGTGWTHVPDAHERGTNKPRGVVGACSSMDVGCVLVQICRMPFVSPRLRSWTAGGA